MSLLTRLLSFFRPRPRETPWTLSPSDAERLFDQVRAEIPVDDHELRRAKPVRSR